MKHIDSIKLLLYFTFVTELQTYNTNTMIYLLIAFGIFLMAVGVAFLTESRKSDRA